MKKIKNLLVNTDDYEFFVDNEHEDDIYGIQKKVFEENYNIIMDNNNLNDAQEVDVFPIIKVSEKDVYTDEYDIVQDNPIKFPINRIKFVGGHLK